MVEMVSGIKVLPPQDGLFDFLFSYFNLPTPKLSLFFLSALSGFHFLALIPLFLALIPLWH